MGNFQNLTVWQKAKNLAVYIYKLTNQGKLATDYGLKDQIRRAAISIPSNIAEGDELDTDKQSIKHFYYAKGSTAELLTQSIISFEIGYIDKKTYENIEKECKIISSIAPMCQSSFRLKKTKNSIGRIEM